MDSEYDELGYNNCVYAKKKTFVKNALEFKPQRSHSTLMWLCISSFKNTFLIRVKKELKFAYLDFTQHLTFLAVIWKKKDFPTQEPKLVSSHVLSVLEMT